MKPSRRIGWRLALGSAVLLGGFLRLYAIRGQLLLDDEWHGMYYVIGQPLQYLLTHFSIPGATCIPLNLYRWALLHSVGWSELTIRLPAIVFGLASLVLFVPYVKRVIGSRATVLFTFLLAVSPFLVFYSRVARPYSAVVVLGFSAVLSGCLWAESGRRRDRIVYVITAVLAVYFHLFAIVAVLMPALGALALRAADRLGPRSGASNGVAVPSKIIVVTVLVMVASMGVLVLPGWMNLDGAALDAVTGSGQISVSSLRAHARMLSGTAHASLVTLFCVTLVVGGVVLTRRNLLCGVVFCAMYPLYYVALILTSPESINAAIVISRYSITLFPVSFVLVAVGFDAALRAVLAALSIHRPSHVGLAYGVSAVTAVGVLLWTGPLREAYAMPNNFTSHSAFQQRYQPVDWNRTFRSELTPENFKLDVSIERTEISGFYEILAKQSGESAIVEYPMMIGDHFNPLYYYQHFHGREVIVGYTTQSARASSAKGNMFGNNYVDQVLTFVPDKHKIKFANMVDMANLADLRGSGAEYLILHHRFESGLYRVARPIPGMSNLVRRYEAEFGRPVHADRHVFVFRLNPP